MGVKLLLSGQLHTWAHMGHSVQKHTHKRFANLYHINFNQWRVTLKGAGAKVRVAPHIGASQKSTCMTLELTRGTIELNRVGFEGNFAKVKSGSVLFVKKYYLG